VFAPLFSLWDGVSMLGLARLRAFVPSVLILYLASRMALALLSRRARHGSASRRISLRRELAMFAGLIVALAAFVAGGLLWHRPMARLAGVEARTIVFDAHSHTNVSHDVQGTLMRGFDTEAARRWHGRAGFDAFFVTDHNTVAGLAQADGRPVACPGIEVSAWKAHVVLLGDTRPVDQTHYNGSLEELRSLLAASDSAYGALSVLSLPEYERNHRNRLDSLVAAGADGFEIVNASPAANEVPRARRDSVIALAKRTNRFVVGVSDSHGWGATSMVWNLMPLAGPLPTGLAICDTLLAGLRRGFGSSRIVERHRLGAESAWPLWLTAAGVTWEAWRGMDGLLAASWLCWIWLLWVPFRPRYT
jgi:hypothetical protein